MTLAPREEVSAGTVFVPFGGRVVHADTSWPGSTVTLRLVGPDGQDRGRVDARRAQRHHADVAVDRGRRSQPGSWQVRVFGDDVAAAGEPVLVNAYAAEPPPRRRARDRDGRGERRQAARSTCGRRAPPGRVPLDVRGRQRRRGRRCATASPRRARAGRRCRSSRHGAPAGRRRSSARPTDPARGDLLGPPPI